MDAGHNDPEAGAREDVRVVALSRLVCLHRKYIFLGTYFVLLLVILIWERTVLYKNAKTLHYSNYCKGRGLLSFRTDRTLREHSKGMYFCIACIRLY